MIVLGIDTSAVTCSVALMVDDCIKASFSETNGLTHSETLLPAISDVLKRAEVSIEDLDVIAVAAGPGSFTGLRIGISTVKGLAIRHSIPCAAVSTLEGLAMNAADYGGKTVCALMDARRNEFYQAHFVINDRIPCRLIEDRAVDIDRICADLPLSEDLILLGDGAEKFVSLKPEYAPCLAPDAYRLQSAESIAILGGREANKNRLIDCRALYPLYLRLPQAEREWQEKHKS